MITQWSFSRLNDYRKCPAFAKYKHVDKLKEPGSAAMERGSAIHKLAEDFSKGNKKTKAPPELQRFEKQFRALQTQDIIVEEKWALTKEWKPTGFFDPNVWVRLVLDCMSVAGDKGHIVDYKTGKVYEKARESLKLYAVGGFAHFPELKEVKAALWYVDSGETIEDVYTLKDVPALKKYWLKETKAMLNDKTFAPKANASCKWCHFRKANGGPCVM